MTWDEFCKELAKEIGIDKKFISYEVYTNTEGAGMVRFNLFKGKPFQFCTAIENDKRLCNSECAYRLSLPLMHYAKKAIEDKLPKNKFFPFTF